MNKLIGHFKTINEHRMHVRQGCFRIGLYYQGLTHDLSKYSPSEFFVGVKYYQGFRSPNNAEREARGYSSAWIHHKGRNKHHYEYWNDYCPVKKNGTVVPVRMPMRYLAEMYVDRVAACKVYRGKGYNNSHPLEYFLNSKDHIQMHDSTKRELERLLRMLANKGEKTTERFIRRCVLKDVPGAYIAELIANRTKRNS